MTSRPALLPRPGLKLKLGGALFALSLGLVACTSSTTTPTSTTTDTFSLKVNFTGVGGTLPITITDSAGTSRTFTLASGGTINDLKGTYTVTGPAVNGHTTPAAQTVDLTTANQSITLAY